MRRGWLAAAALTMLPWLGGGCGAVILHATAKGSEGPSRLSDGMAREQVEEKLGGPVSTRKLPDGGALAVYEYRLPDPEALRLAKDAMAPWLLACGGYAAAVPCGVFTELYFFPYAIYKAATGPRAKVTFTYGPDGRLLYLGAPPAYQPLDDAVETSTPGQSRQSYGLDDTVGAPSIGVLRGLCRRADVDRGSRPAADEGAKELTAAEQYVDCVSTGLAIWGLE